MASHQYPEELRKLAQSYTFKNEKMKSEALVILVHGFGASATETRPLGNFLYAQGYDVIGVLLKGHGTKPEDMDEVSWEEWIDDIRNAYNDNQSEYKQIFIGGVSMGGAVSLYSATELNFDGVFTVSAFYHRSKTLTFVAWFLSLFGAHRPRNESRIQWYLEKNLFSYPEDSLHAANQLYKMLRSLHNKINEIDVPVLIVHSKEDETAVPEGAEEIFEDLKTDKKELFFLPKGDHILTVDPIAQEAFSKILSFLNDLKEN